MPTAVKRYITSILPPLRHSWEQNAELVFPHRHSQHIRRHRAQLIVSRVRLVSALFAVLTPLWIVVDYIAFDWPLWGILALLRLGACGVFVALAWPRDGEKSLPLAYMSLSIMLAVPPVFYLIAHPFLVGVEPEGLAGILARAYSLLPFIVVAGLCVFPLTLFEVIVCALPVMAVSAIGAAQGPVFDIADFVNTVWLLGLVTGVAAFSGMSQLHYMIALINQASHDLLSGAFTRRSGEEAIDLQYRICARTNTPLAIAFIDIDNFKSVNDIYGHEEGDAVLRGVAKQLKKVLRRSDTLVRWGGEEFIIMLPNTDAQGIDVVIQRLRELGLGRRPDGLPVTASIGVAERIADGTSDWMDLIELADNRMYQAKRGGKNACISFDDRNYAELLLSA
ncbi:GGDEF domain-containing protein [Telmatospirillum sp. J64-1]|uniref:GGDEF domain-containing protein n=1 Tax=Telmatospirillum sp. J64-1 TaxID=2502183 RepID=UPI001C8F22DA|nr:GGDEF domain-containing protein [Telmatospirillum sp. J64-1]